MKTVILDFDGTIGDSRSLIVATMQATMARLGLPVCGAERCAGTIGLPLRDSFMQLISMDDETGKQCERVYTELFLENNVPGTVKMFPGVKDTIARIHAAGHIVAIASSRGRDSLTSFVREMNLERYVSHIVSADDVEHSKPSPDMVLRILELTDTRKEDALVVGDAVYDIEMAHNAGVKACGVTYGNGTLEELSGADYVIGSFAGLADILKL